MAKRKKVSGLSIAIVALNIVIVGIIILLIVLIYLHMKEDTGNNRTETVTAATTAAPEETSADLPAVSSSNPVSSAQTTGENTEGSTEETAAESWESATTDLSGLILPQYDKAFFSDDLFIGDSISTGLSIYDYLEPENVFAEVGLNPESAVSHKIGDYTCVEKAAEMQPKRIYVMLGTNGLAFMDSEYMSKKMTELVAELEMACPTAKICVISLPPVTKEHDAEGNETMAKINEYNSKLEALCTMGGFTYVDICSKLQDSDGYFSSQYAEADGLHFLGSAYALLLGTIQNQIG